MKRRRAATDKKPKEFENIASYRSHLYWWLATVLLTAVLLTKLHATASFIHHRLTKQSIRNYKTKPYFIRS